MDKSNITSRKPDFVGLNVAVWVNQRENGKTYLSIKLWNGLRFEAEKQDDSITT